MNKLTDKEAKAWQTGQLELVNQLIKLLPTHDIENLLKDWKQILEDNQL